LDEARQFKLIPKTIMVVREKEVKGKGNSRVPHLREEFTKGGRKMGGRMDSTIPKFAIA